MSLESPTPNDPGPEPRQLRPSVTARGIWLGLRVVLGGLFLWSGLGKLADPGAFAIAVRNFDLITDPWVAVVALGLPWLEVACGLLVVAGWWTRASSALLASCLIGFTAGLISAWARGLDIACGCFGEPSDEPVNYAWAVLRNGGLLAIALWLTWRPAADTARVSTGEQVNGT